MFWTRPVPATGIDVRPGRGDARMDVSVSMLDYFTVGNAIFRNGPDPLAARASVDIRWTGTGERTTVENEPGGFVGTYENATADVGWRAANEAGYFFSTQGSTETHVAHAFTVKLRNGVFV